MKLYQLIDELQQIAHMGHAQDEALFTDLTNEHGTKMLEPLRPRLLGYTACDGKISLRIHDERVTNVSYNTTKLFCECCQSTAEVQPVCKYTDNIKVWRYLRKIGLSENSWVCKKCIKALEEGTR